MLPFTCTPPVEANIEGVSRIHSSWSSESDLTTDSCPAGCMPPQRHAAVNVWWLGGTGYNRAVGTSGKSNDCHASGANPYPCCLYTTSTDFIILWHEFCASEVGSF